LVRRSGPLDSFGEGRKGVHGQKKRCAQQARSKEKIAAHADDNGKKKKKSHSGETERGESAKGTEKKGVNHCPRPRYGGDEKVKMGWELERIRRQTEQRGGKDLEKIAALFVAQATKTGSGKCNGLGGKGGGFSQKEEEGGHGGCL